MKLCSRCLIGYYLGADNLCYTQCPSRYIASNSSLICSKCPYDCLRCDDNKNCLSCSLTADFRFLDRLTSRCIPIDGYYDNLVQISSKCPSTCFTCSSERFCFSCASGYYLMDDNLCYNSCPKRYLLNSELLKCEKCPFDCWTCDSRAQCLSCDPLDFRQLSSSIGRCLPNDGYF